MNRMARNLFILILLYLLVGTVTAADDIKTAKKFQEKKSLLLVHGLGCDTSSWGHLERILNKRGFEVFTLDFNKWDHLPNAQKKKKKIEDLVVVLAQELNRITKKTKRDKVYIMAHSFGGIIVRAYLADFGLRVDKTAGYNDNVERIIYICTPHFGVDASEKELKDLIVNTDYGPFKNAGQMVKALQYGSALLHDINEYFVLNYEEVLVKQITVSSEADSLVSRYSANLDGIQFAPSIDDEWSLVNSHHVFLKEYCHTDPDLLKTKYPSIIDIESPDHPIVDLALSFFNDDLKWRWMGIIPYGEGRNFLSMKIARADGVDPRKLKKKTVKLNLYETAAVKKRVKLKFNKDSSIYYLTDVRSGAYELLVPVGGKFQAFNIGVDSPKNAGNLMTFDADNPPPDPFDDPGGDGPTWEGELPEGIEKPTREPEDVHDLATLRQFALFHFGPELFVHQTPSMSGLAKRIRDKIIERYDKYFLPWPDSAFAHFDAFGDRIAITTIDFVLGSTAPGKIWYRLTWQVHHNPFWAY